MLYEKNYSEKNVDCNVPIKINFNNSTFVNPNNLD